jgi:hypothetical protein
MGVARLDDVCGVCDHLDCIVDIGHKRERTGREVAAAAEPLVGAGAGELVDGEALAAGCAEGGGRAVRELESRIDLDSFRLEVREPRLEVVDAMHEHRRLPLQVLGEDQPRPVGDAHLGDAGTEGLDSEHHLAAKEARVVAEVAGNVGARHVEEVELAERLQGRATSFDWR